MREQCVQCSEENNHTVGSLDSYDELVGDARDTRDQIALVAERLVGSLSNDARRQDVADASDFLQFVIVRRAEVDCFLGAHVAVGEVSLLVCTLFVFVFLAAIWWWCCENVISVLCESAHA